MKAPLISVIMPVYNREKYLAEAIESILNQTEADFEFLILDDGSTDRSLTIAKSFTDPRIRVIAAEKNAGISATLNKGIREARGAFIARMDSDDIALPQRLEKELKAMKDHPEAAFIAGLIMQMDEKGNDRGFWDADRLNSREDQIRSFIGGENCIANPTVMFRKEVLEKYGYREYVKESEDWDLWLRMFSAGERMYKINEVLLRYRIHDHSITTQYNRNSIYLKKSRIQLSYVFHKLGSFQINGFDLKVLRHGFLNILKHLLFLIHPSALPGIKQIATGNAGGIYSQYISLLRACREWEKNKTSLYFFFPFYHTGGAEKVHAEILEAVAGQKPVVLITGVSAGKGFYDEFRKSAQVVDISLISDYPIIHHLLRRKIAESINKNKNANLFGCNSSFYYTLLPLIRKEIRCMDLTHAFVHEGEPGPELWSLPFVERLDNRIVIAGKVKEDFRKLYKQRGLDESLTDRILYFPNYTEVPPVLNKSSHETLEVLYVGRASYEKRVHLVGQIARTLSEKGVKVGFTLIGDMQNALHEEDKKFCHLTGEITDQKVLQTCYDKADILLITSSREGFPMVIMEAMARGVVPLSTDVGGISEHVIPGDTGELIAARSENAIVDDFVRVISTLSANRDLLKQYSENCHRYAGIHFNKEGFTQSYRNLLLRKNEEASSDDPPSKTNAQ